MARRARTKRTRGGFVRRLIAWLLALVILGPPLAVLIYRFAAAADHHPDGRAPVRGPRHRPSLATAIGDQPSHGARGGRLRRQRLLLPSRLRRTRAIEAAIRHNAKKPGRLRGGSTISQQTAKNVFLWPQRSWVRKGAEAYFTVLIEAIWGKRRIMEVYLNTIEFGPGIYGVESASRRYFGVDADELAPAEADRLAAIIPSPLKWSAAHPGAYVRRRTGRIGARSGTVARGGLAACVLG